jgi:hypothetical protein
MARFYQNIQAQVPGTPSAFGETTVVNDTPQVQLDFQYGIDGELVETFIDTSPGTGSVSVSDDLATCQTGTGVGGYGVIRSKHFQQYKAGQGCLGRFTACFTTGVANSIQWVGFGSLENKLSVGYNGTVFSINRRTGGFAEIRTLTVTDGTGTGAADLVLNGVTFNPVLTAGTTAFRAQEIAEGGTGGVTYTGWRAEAIGSTVVFQSESIGSLSGSYSLSTVGAGTFATTRAGAADGDNWVAQSDFNMDTIDGTGPSGMNIDPTKLNVFEIQYQWPGGDIVYSVENPETGSFVQFHRIEYANRYTTPSLQSPAMQLELVAASLGSTTNLAAKAGDMSCFVEGRTVHSGKLHASGGDLSTSSATAVPIFSVKPADVFNSKINFAEMHPVLLTFASSSSGNKPGFIDVYRSATLTAPLWTAVSSGNSHVIQDTSATALSGGELIMSFSLPSTGSESVGLVPMEIIINKADTITVAARSVSGTIDFSATLTWEEDY